MGLACRAITRHRHRVTGMSIRCYLVSTSGNSSASKMVSPPPEHQPHRGDSETLGKQAVHFAAVAAKRSQTRRVVPCSDAGSRESGE